MMSTTTRTFAGALQKIAMRKSRARCTCGADSHVVRGVCRHCGKPAPSAQAAVGDSPVQETGADAASAEYEDAQGVDEPSKTAAIAGLSNMTAARGTAVLLGTPLLVSELKKKQRREREAAARYARPTARY